jgi:hypothetical protein
MMRGNSGEKRKLHWPVACSGKNGRPDLNCFIVEAAMNSAKGTARSMGVDVV